MLYQHRPGSDPCADRDLDTSNLLKSMLALWQSLARRHGFLGLHILGTLNHANDAGGVVDAMGGAKHVGGLLQFLPTALLRTTPPEWSWKSSFEQCNTHSDTPNNCSCFLENLGSDQVHAAQPQHTHHLRRVMCNARRASLTHHTPDCCKQVDQVFTRSIADKGSKLGFARGAMASWSSFPRGRNKAGWVCTCPCSLELMRPARSALLLPRFRSIHAQALCSNRSPHAYGKLVHLQLLRALSDAGGPARCAHRNARGNSSDVAAWRHLVVVNAWNEWGEQAVVEPSVQDGDEMLLAHRRAVEDVEKHVVEKHVMAQMTQLAL